MEPDRNSALRGLTFCICGGGSLAHAVAAVLSSSPLNQVHVLTRKPDLWSKNLTLNYRNEAVLAGRLHRISREPSEVVPQADVVLVLVPHAFREDVLRSIAPFLRAGTWVGAMPGFAGFGWTARYLLGNEVRLFGFQRVPYVCRKVEYGAKVLVTGIRPRNYIASLPSCEVNTIAAILRCAMNLYMVPMQNYLNVCLSRSNTVFHPARLYGLCREWDKGQDSFFNEPQNFYSDWDERSSEVFLGLDAEMRQLAATLPLDLGWAQPVLQHYEVAFPQDLTRRIRSIEALADRPFPMTAVPGGFIPDTTSYYFTEDIAYGLTTLKALFDLADVESPVTDSILRWAQKIMNKRWINENGKLCMDHPGMPWPQRFGIRDVAGLADFCVHGELKNLAHV